MDFCDEILDENDRYAFLLGSALRNQDYQHFFQVYDKVLPKDLDQIELDSLKERARQLSALSEEDFAAIAARARDFSLAQPKDHSYVMYDNHNTEELSKIESMRGTASVSSISSLTSDFPVSDVCPMDKPDFSSLMRTSRHFGPQSEAEFSISDASDSGICLNSSSKLGSMSDSEEPERIGVFDYIQSRPEPKVEVLNVKAYSTVPQLVNRKNNCTVTSGRGGKITVHNKGLLTSDNDDEEGEEDEDYQESPRSDVDLHPKQKFEKEIEMVKIHRDCESPDNETTTLLGPDMCKVQRKSARKKNNEMYDEAFIVDEGNNHDSLSADSGSSDQDLKQVVVDGRDSSDDVDIDRVSVHQRLYEGGISSHSGHRFNSMRRDFREEYIMDDDDDDENEGEERALKRLDSSPHHSISNYGTSKPIKTTFSSQSSYDREVQFRSKQYYNSARSYGGSFSSKFGGGSYGSFSSSGSSSNRNSVDKPVNFGLSSSGGVRVEKSVSSVVDSSLSSLKAARAPFGDPLQMDKITQRNSKLLGPLQNSDDKDYRNMPEAEMIKSEGNKKKKKKKKKDENEEKHIHDINGNPLEEGRAKPNSKQVEPYSRFESSAESSRFPSRLSQFDSQCYGPYIRDHDDNMQANIDQKYYEKKARKNKKKEQETKHVITSDKIPGHRGNQQLDSLLDFIEGNKGGKIKTPTKKDGPLITTTNIHSGVIGQIPNPFNAVQSTEVSVENDYQHSTAVFSSSTKHDNTDEIATVNSTPVATTKQDKVFKNKKNHNNNQKESWSSNIFAKDNSTVECDSSVGSGKLDNKGVNMGPTGLPVETTTVSATFTLNYDNTVGGKKDSIDSNRNLNKTGADRTFNNQIAAATDSYIFTDFDIPKPTSEVEFQTVSSSKKKKSNFSKKNADVRMNGNASGGNWFSNYSFGSYNKRLGNGAKEYLNSFHQKQQQQQQQQQQQVGNTNNIHKYPADKRSYTPPPTPTIITVETKPNERAFSPSAFPALGKSGRRYSTGNAKEIEEEIEVDSDIESCKSVPAASDKNIVNNNKQPGDIPLNSMPAGIRPLPVVSYAKVVGGKPNVNQQQKANSVDEAVDDLPICAENGLTERRHSLGNMPMPGPSHLDNINQGVAHSQELVNGERTSSSGASSLSTSSKASSLSNSKYGSIENLNHNKESSPPSNVEVTVALNPSSDTDFPPITSTSSSFTSETSSTQQHNISSSYNKWSSPPSLISSHNTTSQSATAADTVVEDSSISSSSSSVLCKSSSNSNKVNSGKVSVGGSSQPAIPAQKPNYQQHLTNDKLVAVTSNSSSNVSKSSSKTNSNPPSCVLKVDQQHPPRNQASDSNKNVKTPSASVDSKSGGKPPPRKVTNGSKPTKTTQSVIFLDRKFSEQTPNLGISFGFEPDLELNIGGGVIDTINNNLGLSSSDLSGATVESSKSLSSSTSSSSLNNVNVIKSSTNVDDSSSGISATKVVDTKHNEINNVITVESNLDGSYANKKCELGENNKKVVVVPTRPVNGIILNKTPVLESGSANNNTVVVSKKEQINVNTELACNPPLTSSPEQNASNITFSAEIVLTSSVSPHENKTIFMSNQEMDAETGGLIEQQHYTLPSREQDPNYHRGRYEQDKVCNYLYNEWCSVMQDGDKVCDGVSLYGRDLN